MGQLTDTVLMVRPAFFCSNTETARDNPFQRHLGTNLLPTAQHEFDLLASALNRAGVSTCIVQDSLLPATPDAVFPNNRLSFHASGVAVIYPMLASNRRTERSLDVFPAIERETPFKLKQLIDYRDFETRSRFLEGTGSMVLDRIYRVAYACLSQRTDEQLVQQFCRDMGYSAHIFTAGARLGGHWSAIYHTNVMLSLGEDFAIVVADAIPKLSERQRLLSNLSVSGRNLIILTLEQMRQFGANVLQLRGASGDKIIVMSSTARRALKEEQRALLESQSTLVDSAITTIEQASGGSVRCMLAEIFHSE